MAQSGRVLGSGPRGRWFESSHSDDKTLGIFAISGVFCCLFIVKLLLHVECPCNSDRNNTIFCICVSVRYNIFIVYKCPETTKKACRLMKISHLLSSQASLYSILTAPIQAGYRTVLPRQAARLSPPRECIRGLCTPPASPLPSTPICTASPRLSSLPLPSRD